MTRQVWRKRYVCDTTHCYRTGFDLCRHFFRLGLAAEENEKIFERGFGKNTGMGLFLAREILGITRITIRESGEPGKGARFEMTVPNGTWRMAGATTQGD